MSDRIFMNKRISFVLWAVLLPVSAGLFGLPTVARAIGPSDVDFQIAVDELTDLPDTDPGDGQCKTQQGGCSLRAAIQESNEDTTRIWEVLLPSGTIAITSPEDNKQGETDETGDYEIYKSIVFTGAADGSTILEGTNFSRIFDIHRDTETPVEVLMQNLTLTKGPILYDGGLPTHNGSQIFSRGALVLDRVTVRDGGSSSNAVYNDGESLRVTDSRFIGNGRGIATDNGQVVIENSRFENNFIREGGAGLWARNARVEIHGSTFTGNTSDSQSASRGFGGAIQQLGGTLIIDSSRFENNICVLGGALYSTGTLLIRGDVTFSGNKAQRKPPQDPNSPRVGDGGALYLAAGLANIRDVTFSGNSAERSGGAIYVVGEAEARIRRVALLQNSAGVAGGGAFFEATTHATQLLEAAVVRNRLTSADNGRVGGGLCLLGGVTVRNSLISENKAINGAGVFASGTGNVIENSTVVLNSNEVITNKLEQLFGEGGGILFDSPADTDKLTLTHVTVAGNASKKAGASALLAANGKMVLKNSLILTPSEDSLLCSGSFESAGYNVVGDNSCNLGGTGDLNNASGEAVRQLADNGGQTLTAAVFDGGVAVGHVPAANCLPTDQRLFERVGDTCDAGAYESDGLARNGGEVNFLTRLFPRGEAAGEVHLTVERNGGSDGPLSVEVTDLRNGTASPEIDYHMDSPQVLQWADGDDAPKTFRISILDDINKEALASETVNLALLNVSGTGRTGDRDLASLTIQDDDTVAYGEYRLDRPDYTVQEKIRDDTPNNTGTGDNKKPKNNTVTISIERIGPSDQAATFRYRTTAGTATQGKDYKGIEGLVTFQPDETVKAFKIEILDDDLFEPDETFFFEISKAPSQGPVFFSTPVKATVTIISDDAKKADPLPPVRDRTRPATGSMGMPGLILLWLMGWLRKPFRDNKGAAKPRF